MSLSTILKPPSLAGRLTVWYTLVSTLLFLLAIATIYLFTGSVLSRQVDEDLLEDITEFEDLLLQRGLDGMWQQLQAEAAADGSEQILFRLFSPGGELLRSSDDGTWGDYALPEPQDLIQGDSAVQLSTVQLPGMEYPSRTALGVLGNGAERYYLQISESLEERADVLEVFRLTLLASIPVLLALSLLAGWLMARKSLAGVEQVTNTAIHISNGALEERVDLKDQGREIDRLAATFNGMLDKIQLLIQSMREITDNIAHDLKSPLARIRGLAETTLSNGHDSEQYQLLAGSTIEECDRLLHLINTMLDLAETEAGLIQSSELVDLSELIRDACELYQALANQEGIALECKIGDEIMVNGNKQFLQRLIGNLLDNAIKYTPAGGKVSIAEEITGSDVLINFTDNGLGISSADLPKIFQRFYRCDTSRSKPGSGLGLSLALAIARAHLGNISVQSSEQEGSRFIVTLPLVSPV